MALSLDMNYMRLPTCMALFRRWHALRPGGEGPPGQEPYADMTLDAVRRSVVRHRLEAMRPDATYEQIAETLGITKKTLRMYRNELGLQ